MRSIKFPKMFNTNSTNVWKASEYLESTKQNTKLLLRTERGEMFGDPYFGLLLKHYMFYQNNSVLKDMLIDMIYTQLVLFLPQLKIERRNISITRSNEKGKVYISFSAVNQIDYQPNTYKLTLFNTTDNNV